LINKQIASTVHNSLSTYMTFAIILMKANVAQLAERRSLAGELTLSCARPSEDGWPLCG